MSNIEYGLFDTVISSMEAVEALIELTGEEKKLWVLARMKDFLSETAHDRYKDILPIMVDFIIAVSKNKLFLDLNIKSCNCFPWTK
jgi:very-short-patch-repair endonuclease